MSSKGFTLIEILIAIAITMVSMAYVTYFAIDLSNFGIDLNTRLETERELEMALRVMISEIRSMGPGGNGAYPIATATSTEFTFFSDINADGKFEQVRYFLEGTILKKGVITPTATEPVLYPTANEVISEMVHFMIPSTVFSYYPSGFPDETGPLASPTSIALIRLIKISGTTDKDVAQPPTATTLGITITIRNLRGEI